MKKILLIFMVLVVSMALLAACGDNTQTNNGAADDTANAGTAGTAEKMIRISADSTPVIDPAIGISNSASIAFVNLYDSLVFPDGEDVKPLLAENWDISEDGTEYTFHLKKGVKFHDGDELKASDVVFSTKRLLTIGEGFAYVYSDIIKDVTAVDDYTVKFTLNHSFGPFVASLCRLYIMNEDLVMSHLADGSYGEFGDYGREWLITHDAGSGPYMAQELVQQDHFTATRFEDWNVGWKENAPDAFKIIYSTEPTTVRTMMANKDLEITDMWQTTENLATLDKIEGIDLASYSTRLVQNVYFNTTIPPTDDLNFRKALSCLLDYNMFVKDIFVDSKICAGPVSSYTAGHVNTTQYQYNLEKAKEYIAQSKYAGNYQDYPIEFLCNSDVQDLEKVALSFQAAAKQVGITVDINKAPWVTIQERVSTAASTPNVTTINSGPQYNEAGATLEASFHRKTAGTYENCSWALSDELDAEIEGALATVDKDERYAKYAALQNKVVDEICPCAWIADLTERVAYQSTYVQWPAATASKEGKMVAYLMGYPFFFPDMTILPH